MKFIVNWPSVNINLVMKPTILKCIVHGGHIERDLCNTNVQYALFILMIYRLFYSRFDVLYIITYEYLLANYNF